jgi:outer membrane protein OmpA-like peptidoglycan-associated protein
MKSWKWRAVVTTAFAAGIATACGPQFVRTPERPRKDLIVLLPDDGSGTIGRATVSNPAGSVDLAAARAATTVAVDQSPARVTVLSEADVRRAFGDVLAGLPPQPKSFTLFFRFDSEELTEESRKLVREILQTVKGRPSSDVVVLGHTDTMGTIARNRELGLKRANTIRTLLINNGLDPSSVDVTSFGEAALLVPTADGVIEPRNRRVEITVR